MYWVTLTECHCCGTNQQQRAYLHDKMRTAHPITTKLGWYFPLVMMTTYLGVIVPIGETGNRCVSVGYCVNYMTLAFDLNHGIVFALSKFKFCNFCISGIVGLIHVKRKRKQISWILVQLRDLVLWPYPRHGPWILNVKWLGGWMYRIMTRVTSDVS